MALLTLAVVALLVLLLVGSWIYCVLTSVAARRYLAISPPPLTDPPPISVLKPLCGQDDHLEENLRSFFTQDYPNYEILFAVDRMDDPAVAIVDKVRGEFPHGPKVHLIETGDPTVPNRKAHSLGRLVPRAQHSILVMSDSDVHVPPDLLRRVAAEFQDQAVGVVTCPYRAVPGRGFWSRLEAIGMNTEFLAGVLVAWLVGEMNFALGPTLAARREVIEAMGGFADLGHYLAEDFEIGNRAPRLGYRVVLSSCVIEHRIGSQTLSENLQHRLRWARSTRRSRPIGYWGQIFTNPLPLALLLCLTVPKLWILVAVTVSLSRAGCMEYGGLGTARPAHPPEMVARSLSRPDQRFRLGRGIVRQHHRLAGTPIHTFARWPLSIRRKRTRKNRSDSRGASVHRVISPA